MPSIRQQGQMDGAIFSGAMKEVAGAFEEPVTVLRWTGVTAGNPGQGVPDTDIFQNIRTTAVIKTLTAKDTFGTAGIYVPGDLQAEFRIPVYGAEAQSGDFLAPGTRPDRVLYRNRAYYFVGHVDRKKLTERVFWVGILRQDGA